MPRRRPVAPVEAELEATWRASLDDYVIDARWSPDGQMLAAASVSGPVVRLDAESGESHWSRQAHGFGTTELSWHPGLELLTSAGQDGMVRNWDPHSGDQLSEMDGGSAWVEHVDWNPDGKVLASAAGKRLRLWDPAGSLLQEFDDHSSTIADIAWHPEGTEVVTGAYGGLRFWNVSSPDAVRTLEWRGSILTIAWSPDARFIATGDQDSTVHFWMVRTGKDLQMWGYPTKVQDLSWNARSQYLATGGGPTVAVWDCRGRRGPEGRAPILLEAHEDVITALAFHPSRNLLISGDESGHVALWQPGALDRPIDQLMVGEAVSVVQWSPDGSALIVATGNGVVARLDLRTDDD
jgi:WD40 repeat protein